MIQRLSTFALAFMFIVGCAPEAPPETVGEVTALTGARLIDGTGGPAIDNAVIIIRGERIEGAGPAESVAIPDGAEVIDLQGKTVMPPIISLHNHLALTGPDGLQNRVANFTEQNVRAKQEQYAQFGVLHTVSQGLDKPLVYELIEQQRAGNFPGARMYTAGRGFGVEGGYPPVQPDVVEDQDDVFRLTSPDQVPEAVDALVAWNVDMVKMWVDDHLGTMPPFEPEIYQAIIEESRARGLRSVAHIHTYDQASGVLEAGVDGLVHSVRDLPVDQAMIDQMLADDVFSVATLAREESMFIYAGRAPYLDDPFFVDNIPASTIEILASDEFQQGHRDNPELDEWEPALRLAQENLMTLFNAGVKIGFGSDSGPPARFEGYFEHREMELMVEAGLTPAQVIQIASLNSAEILGIDADFGTIEAGKMAEFLVLDQNPLENISNTKTLEEVWQDGVRIH